MKVQRFTLKLVYLILSMKKPKHTYEWVIGVHEIAAYMHHLGNVLKSSITVNLYANKYYVFSYDHAFRSSGNKGSHFERLFYGPMLLAKLMHQAKGFWYIGENGFLISPKDGRDYELSFLKAKGKKIICMFLGDDIRSPKKLNEYGLKQGHDVLTTYYHQLDLSFFSDGYECRKERLAKASEKHADFIFSASLDQLSYLDKEQLSIFYMYPDNQFRYNPKKFENIKRVKIVHAPTSPIIKGTPLVRAAIKGLKEKGYHFDYVELQNMPHQIVLNHLREAHIVLNQFYAFVPSVFGIEALASHCAVMMSADLSLEPLMQSSQVEPWIKTNYWNIEDKLEFLLQNPGQIHFYADKGYDWALQHWSYSHIGKNIQEVLKNV